MQKIKLFSVLFIATLLSSCLSSTATYEGISYPQTSNAQATFQEEGIPGDCMAFSHLMMTSKKQSSGKEIASAMHKEAEIKGANLILVGMSRELSDDGLDENRFNFYGPEFAYSFQKTWLGWKFGFDEWDEADSISNLGIDSWGNEKITFDNSLIIQAVLLRCGKN